MQSAHLIAAAALCLPLAARAQTTNQTTRPLSLQECIELAVQHNLQVQIDRMGPEIAQFTLDSSIGTTYDPVASMTLRQGFSSIPSGRTDPTTGFFLPTPIENYTDTYSPSISGFLPTGARVAVTGNLTRSSGTSFPTSFQYNDNASLSLTQPLLKNAWIDSSRLTIELNRKNILTSEQTLRLTLINTVNSVQQAYYDLIYDVENVKVQQASLGLAEKLLAENKKRVEVGALAPLDEKQAESQVAARKADLISAQHDLEAQQNLVRSLLTDDYSSWHSVQITPTDTIVAVPQTFNLQQSWQAGMTSRPEVLQARLDLERQNITLRYNYNQLFPQLDLTASYGYNGLGNTLATGLDGLQSGRNQFYSYGLVLSVPLSNMAARNNYKSAKANVAQSLLRLKQQEQSVLTQIDNAMKSAQTAYDKIDATRQARVYAEIALDAEQKKLESGKSTSFVVLQLQRDLTAARSAEIRALADYYKALAALGQAEGTTLEKTKVKLEVK